MYASASTPSPRHVQRTGATCYAIDAMRPRRLGADDAVLDATGGRASRTTPTRPGTPSCATFCGGTRTARKIKRVARRWVCPRPARSTRFT